MSCILHASFSKSYKTKLPSYSLKYVERSTSVSYTHLQASDDLLTEEEKEQLQSTVLSAAESVREIYKDIVIADALSYSSGISEFTKEQRKAVVEMCIRDRI